MPGFSDNPKIVFLVVFIVGVMNPTGLVKEQASVDTEPDTTFRTEMVEEKPQLTETAPCGSEHSGPDAGGGC